MALGRHFAGVGRQWRLIGCDQWQVVRQPLQEEIAILDRHWWADMNLDGQHAFELPAFGVEVDDIDGRMPIDPVAVMVSLNEDTDTRANPRA